MATEEKNSTATHVDDTHTHAHEVSTAEGQGSITNGACAIDMLTDDALLNIFSYLVLLCDRGQVARLVHVLVETVIRIPVSGVKANRDD